MSEQAALHEERDLRVRAVIRESLDDTLFVEAGAGTGKTSALVERVVALVRRGVPIDQIIVITFTDKAAGELRDRVRSELEKACDEHREEAGLISVALGSLERAQISTIHSFCQSLLYTFAAEAGVDPSFAVEDEVTAERRLEEQWRLYLEGLAGDDDASNAIDRVLGLGLTTSNLFTLAAGLSEQADLAYRMERHPLTAPSPDWPDLGQFAARLEALGIESADADDELRKRVSALSTLISDLVPAASDGDREALLGAGAAVTGQAYWVGSQAAWPPGSYAAVVAEARSISEALKETLAACRAAALAQMIPYVVRFVLEDCSRRSREGAITFDDLILRVRDLLRDSPEAVRALRAQYAVMLIDEFQDTDPLQVDIALAFAVDPDSQQLERGRLFVVGDPKQSIYRFRRADMATYARVKERLEADGSAAQLSLNRRSTQPILRFVNDVFATIIGNGNSGVQPAYAPITAHRADDVAGPGVAYFGGPVDRPARQVRELEAQTVAAQCRAAISEQWQVIGMDEVARPARYADIAILIPARTGLPALERALTDAGIPYRVESGSLIYKTQEVRDLLNCLTAIDDPANEVAVLGALRSPAFACSDVDLARHRAAGGRFGYMSSGLDGISGPVAEGLRSLRRYHQQRHSGSLAYLIERFVGEHRQVETGILDTGDRNSFRRARFVVEQARAFEANGPESLRAFVTWMRRRADQAILDNEGAGLDDDEDAVRVMTIHGAKGLEFPIVFVAGLGTPPQMRTGVYLRDGASGDVGVCIGAATRFLRFEVGPVAHLQGREKEHALAEYDRLLYVACTRARDHLVLSLFHKVNESRCAAAKLIGAGAKDLAVQRPDSSGSAPSIAPAFADLAVDLPDIPPEQFGAERQAVVDAATQRRYTSATAMYRSQGGVEDGKADRQDDSEPWARGRGGTRLGRAVHAAIQSLPLDADDTLIEAFSIAQAVAEAVPKRADEVARLVRWCLRSSQAAARARTAARVLREVPFALSVDGRVLEGFIDMLLQTDDGIEIIDWKTDQIRADQVPARVRDYELQAGLYVYGMESATGLKVHGITYVFASAQTEVSLGEPAMLAKAAQLVFEGQADDFRRVAP